MKVILLNGSPKPKGCTYTALTRVAESLEKNGVETEIIHIGANVTSGCMGCGYCRNAGRCVNDKDCLNSLLDKIKSADGYVFGTPVHYAGASGALTAFMDRLFYSSGTALAYKPAAVICTCRRGGATATFDQINKYFTINNMPVVSSSYWNMAHGNTPEEVVQDAEGMQIMSILGKNMAWLVKCIDLGNKNGCPVPEREDKVSTNFIR